MMLVFISNLTLPVPDGATTYTTEQSIVMIEYSIIRIYYVKRGCRRVSTHG